MHAPIYTGIYQNKKSESYISGAGLPALTSSLPIITEKRSFHPAKALTHI